jgi:Holliday junction resolvasome RuvABC endonuclease subunit
MSHFSIEFTRALAIDPASRGLGFALLEGPSTLIDWGFHDVRKDRDARCLALVISMLTTFKPDVLVLEDFGTCRSARVKALADAFAAAAKERGIASCRVSRKAVRSRFPTCRTKYDRARELVARFPELKAWCPPTRKIWLTEDPRINIFDALGLAVTHVSQTRKGASGASRNLEL